jgi:hypothetical protein
VDQIVVAPNENAHQLRAIMHAPAQFFVSYRAHRKAPPARRPAFVRSLTDLETGRPGANQRSFQPVRYVPAERESIDPSLRAQRGLRSDVARLGPNQDSPDPEGQASMLESAVLYSLIC